MKIYLKHKHSSKLFIVTENQEVEIDFYQKSESHKTLSARKPCEKLNNPNFQVIQRFELISKVNKANMQLKERTLSLLNVQLKIQFHYKLLPL